MLSVKVYVSDGSLQQRAFCASGGKVKVAVQGVISPSGPFVKHVHKSPQSSICGQGFSVSR